VVHDRTFEIPQTRQLSHVRSSPVQCSQSTPAYYRPSYRAVLCPPSDRSVWWPSQGAL